MQEIRLIVAQQMHSIIPLLRVLNPKLSEAMLAQRLDEMLR